MKQDDRIRAWLEAPEGEEAVRVSIYLPTHRSRPENQQDPIRYRNLVQQAARALEEEASSADAKAILERLNGVLADGESDFWNHLTEGLAVLATPKRLLHYHLLEPVPERVTVGPHFHVMPLLHNYEQVDRALVLDLARDRFNLLQVGTHALEPVDTGEMRTRFRELFDDLDSQANVNVGSYAGRQGAYHGHRARPEEVQKDREKYFRYIDQQLASWMGDTPRQVVLAGTEENRVLFRELARGGFYLDSEVTKPLDSMEPVEASRTVRDLLRPRDEARALQRIRWYRQQAAHEQTVDSSDPDALGEAIAAGRVGRLMVDPGAYEVYRGQLDDWIASTLMNRGEVLVLEAEQAEELGVAVGAELRY